VLTFANRNHKQKAPLTRIVIIVSCFTLRHRSIPRILIRIQKPISSAEHSGIKPVPQGPGSAL
jgi:hypothetical protein